MPAIRFALAVVSLLVSLIVLVKAPNLALWQLKLGATEFGHWFALVPLVLLFLGRRQSFVDTLSSLFCIVAVGIFLSSGIRGLMFEKVAKGKMDAVFPLPAGTTDSVEPFHYTAMWSFGKPRAEEPETMDYNELGSQKLSLDFYAAREGKTSPCVVMIHGGGWDDGTRSEFKEFNHFLVEQGISVAAIDYRLAPKSPWPAQRDDVRAALGLLKAQANALGIAPDKFILMGRSAGGQIAEAIAAGGEIKEVIGCVALYSPADMEFAFKYADAKDILNSDKLLRQYLGGAPTDAAENYKSASAYLRVNPRSVPTLLIHGRGDELVWYQQSHRYAEKLAQQNVKHVYLELPWATHAFDYSLHGPGGQITKWAVLRFVRSVGQ